MRPTRILLLTLALAIPPPGGAGEAPPAAPELEATTLAGGEISLDELRGQVVLLEFWASWCRSCIAGLPAVKELHTEHAEDGLAIVGVSLDEEVKAARRAISEHDLTWPQICDGEGKESPIARSFDVRGTPRFVLIDREGRIAHPYVKPSELEDRVRELMAAD